MAMLDYCCCMGFSLVAVSSGYSSLQHVGFSLLWLLLFGSTGSRACGHERSEEMFQNEPRELEE